MSAVGIGFITKMLQAFLVVPAFGLVYLSPPPPRCAGASSSSLAGAVALVVAVGLVGGGRAAHPGRRPALHRRVAGQQPAQPDLRLQRLRPPHGQRERQRGRRRRGRARSGARPGGSASSASEFGAQISWLIPAALILALAALWLWRRRPAHRRGPQRPAAVGRLARRHRRGHQLGQGDHPPLLHGGRGPGHRRHGRHRRLGPVGATRRHSCARVALAAALAATAVWSYVLLDRDPAVDAVAAHRRARRSGCLAAVLLVFGPRLRGKAALALGAVGVVVALAGPGRLRPRHRRHRPLRGDPLGRAVVGHGARWAGPGGAAGFGGPPAASPGRGAAGAAAPGRRAPARASPAGPARARLAAGPGGPVAGAERVVRRGGFGGPTATPGARGAGASPFGGGRRRWGRGVASCPSAPRAAKLVKALEADAGHYTWVAATVNSNSAAGYQLATDDPVMAIGGFNGTDPAPTLAQFERDVAAEEDPLLHLRGAAVPARAARARRPDRSPSGSRATSRPRPSTA